MSEKLEKEYIGFDKLKGKLAGEKGVTDPGGLAAAIGRKKYGKKKFDDAAAKDKSPNKKVKKSDEELELDTEIEEVAKAMELSTIEPISEIQKAVLELGPEGLKKALPNMTEENKELLNEILEEMNKSHTLPLAAPRKLTNVGGENYVQEDVSGDEADEAMFEAAVKEGDNEQKHQGGSHDQPYKLDWEGQMIKSLDDFTMEELSTFGEVYKAMKMKKMMKKGDDKDRHEKDEKYDKDEAAEAYEGRDDAEKKGDKKKAEKYERDIEQDMDHADYDRDRAEVEKAMKKKKEDLEKVSASPKLWGSTKPRGVGIYKGDDESVDAKVKEIEGPAKVNEVLDDTKEDKKDDVLAALRDKKMKKAKAMMKNIMKKECPEEMDEGKAELMKNKMRKALVEVLSEEYTDEEIAKAKKEMKKDMSEADKDRYESDEKYDKDEAAEAYEGRDDAEKKGEEGKAAKYEKDIEEDMTDADYDKDKAEGKKEFEKKMKKARELFIAATHQENPVVADLLLEKAKEMMASDHPEASQVKSPAHMNKAGKAGKVEEGLASKTKADDVKIKKSIRYYGEPNDAFKAGRVGRHNYTASVNEYYDQALYKAANPGKKEEELRKSVDYNNVNDLIEHGLTSTDVEIQNRERLGEFKKSRGNFSRTSFSEEDMIQTLHISKKDLKDL